LARFPCPPPPAAEAGSASPEGSWWRPHLPDRSARKRRKPTADYPPPARSCKDVGMAEAGTNPSNQPIPVWLLQALKCPICCEPITDTPIFNCSNKQNHSMCYNCYQTLKTEGLHCPVCREPLTEDRSQRLEEIVERMPKVTCKFGGCGLKKVSADVVRAHEENDCQFRIVECGKCDSKIQLNHLVEHLAIKHGRLKFPTGFSSRCHCTINLDDMKKAQGMKVVHDNLLFFDNWAELDDASYIFWFSYFGPKSDAAKYKYSIQIISSKDQKLGKWKYLLEATAICVPCDVSFNEMKRERDCIMLSKKVVQCASEGNACDLPDVKSHAFSRNVSPDRLTE